MLPADVKAPAVFFACFGPNSGTTRPPLDLKDQPYRQDGRKHAQTDDSHFEMKIAAHFGSLLRTDDRTVTKSWALQGAGLRSRARPFEDTARAKAVRLAAAGYPCQTAEAVSESRTKARRLRRC